VQGDIIVELAVEALGFTHSVGTVYASEEAF